MEGKEQQSQFGAHLEADEYLSAEDADLAHIGKEWIRIGYNCYQRKRSPNAD